MNCKHKNIEIKDSPYFRIENDKIKSGRRRVKICKDCNKILEILYDEEIND